MRDLLNMFGGRYDLALAGYNSGENRAEYKAAAAAGRAINWSVMPGNIPTQTRNYVNVIMRAAGATVISVPASSTGAAPRPAAPVTPATIAASLNALKPAEIGIGGVAVAVVGFFLVREIMS